MFHIGLHCQKLTKIAKTDRVKLLLQQVKLNETKNIVLSLALPPSWSSDSNLVPYQHDQARTDEDVDCVVI